MLTALALVLIFEGLLPFISPRKYREMVAQISQLRDNQLRNIGLAAMIIGVAGLFILRG